MSQIFPRSANAIARFSLVGILLFGGLVASIVGMAFRTDYVTGANSNVDQPAPESRPVVTALVFTA